MRFISPLLLVLASSSRTRLVQQVQYLKAENQILRARLPQHLITTPAERARLIQFGKPLGSAIKELISIVSPATFARWVRQEPEALRLRPLRRRRTAEQVRALVVRIAHQTGWGYTRILGELRKLGIRKISRSTIKNILAAHHIQPAPTRRSLVWSEFLRRHTETLWACDFFTKRVWTPRGLRSFHALALIHVRSRRIHIAGISDRPDGVWMVSCAQRMVAFFQQQPLMPTVLLHDRDNCFTAGFDAVLQRCGVQTHRFTPGSPNLNAYIERWIQSVKRECLDHFIVFGEAHLRYLIDEYLDYYHNERPHQGLDNLPPHRPRLIKMTDVPDNTDEIVCRTRLGGLLKHYERRVA